MSICMYESEDSLIVTIINALGLPNTTSELSIDFGTGGCAIVSLKFYLDGEMEAKIQKYQENRAAEKIHLKKLKRKLDI